MSEEIKLITRDELKAIPYGDALKEKFEELGIGEVWKPGSKKDVMITKALEKLALLKSFINTGLTKEEAEAEVERKELRKKEIKQLSDQSKVLIQDKKKVEELKDVQKKELSEEQIIANLENININLGNNIPSQRNILLKKKEALLTLLEEVQNKVVIKGEE